MRNNGEVGSVPSQPVEPDQPRLHIMQLLRRVAALSSIDEVFLLLARTAIDHLGAEAALFWTKQDYSNGEYTLEMRTQVQRDALLPRHLIANDRMTKIVHHILTRQNTYWLQPVGYSFRSYQAIMLHRYGLNFCCGSFIESDALLPPANYDLSPGKLATPTAMVALLFFRRPPAQSAIPAFLHIMQQALLVAKKRGLLRPTTEANILPALAASRLPYQQRSQ